MEYVLLTIAAAISNRVGYKKTSYLKKVLLTAGWSVIINIFSQLWIEKWNFFPILAIYFIGMLGMMSFVHYGENHLFKTDKKENTKD